MSDHAPTPVPSEVAAPETEAARVHLTPRARLVAHPTPDKVWVQVPHRNDIGSDWIEADPSDWLAARDAATADRVRRETAEAAWDEGHRHRQRRGPDECRCAAWSEGECACGLYGTGRLVSLDDNPYRDEAR